MNENKEKAQYPTPGASFLMFIVTFALAALIGNALQTYAFLPGLYVTEWLFFLAPPLFLLWMKKVNIKKTLKIQQLKAWHVLLGIVSGVGIYFISIVSVLMMEDVLGPYPATKFLEGIFPTTWLAFIPWILAIGFSAGICEEVLFRGFIQNGLHNHWGPARGLMAATLLFTVAHLDPWRTPAVILIGLLAGYLLIRTGSLYSAIAVHMTVNTTNSLLAFTETMPKTTDQWLLMLAVSSVMVLCTLIYLEMRRRK